MTAPRGLHALARLHGVQTAYHDTDGRRTAAAPESLLAALRALRVPVRDAADLPRLVEHRRRELWERAVEPVVVAWLPVPGAGTGGRAGAGFVLRLPARLRDAPVRVAVLLEDGEERTAAPPIDRLEAVDTGEVGGEPYLARRVPLPPVPAGYHALHVEVGRGPRRRYSALLIAAPHRAAGWEVLPGSPDWGAFAPLYALWTEEGGEADPHYDLLARLADRV
ncbi:MAG: 4-alpha-glucanotransferase, partial [Gemmatimonadetes bacterium]|nr:4-alpha-glucanotransferase [Gemmatimonadota bacterium]NIQ55780.1 4-alpha-glucanotransferase [Gemmatimonadota bacterium]NIU75994.1 4-alpha-glucanotransferase [Gammaproteobacteria bacterium]NIX45575.1 4-alpha-glucanotransferase [Gemmatimonadota bacterium]NIY09860.1 4-alpha-glucanotransferase [Gemmatimonadota bacterium]